MKLFYALILFPSFIVPLLHSRRSRISVAELREKLRSAAKSTLPADGRTSALMKEGGLWAPQLVD